MLFLGQHCLGGLVQEERISKPFLLSSMDELNSILKKRGSIQEFLADLVTMLAQQMQSSACSVYLYDANRDRLILRATKGLNTDFVDRLELNIGEGITGQAFKDARPMRVGSASQSSFFLSVPGISEERFKAFLAVPIRRGTNPIGVITLEHEEADHFSPQDTTLLRAIASQLAPILEDAEFLMELSQDKGAGNFILPQSIEGTGVGQGICMGQSIVLRREARSFHKMGTSYNKLNTDEIAAGSAPVQKEKKHITEELTRFATSLKATKEHLEDILRSLANSLAEAADIIFSAHMLMLRDTSFSDAMQAMIEQGSTAEAAIQAVVNNYVELFSVHSNPRVQEKTQDVLDLGYLLVKNLDSDNPHIRLDLSGQIIVLADTFPSEIVKFAAERAEGLVMLGGSETAHIALLAKSLNLPAIFVKEAGILDMPDDIPLIIDVDAGRLIVNPDSKVLKQYEKLKKQRGRETTVSIDIPERCRTDDGKAVTILANVNLVQDVTYALEQRAEGIGLYRSEFPFLLRNDFPSEEEQVVIYERIIEPMGKREVVFRTLDAGGDKFIGHNPEHQEANPFLGYRGIRFSLSNEDIFLDQIRAILRAGREGNIGILFPMIGSLEEFIDARNLVYKGMEELQEDGIPFCENPRIGAMIELPSAAEITGELAEESDFLSIGTNDLIMYLLAVDRTNEKVGSLYKPYHPAVLRVLSRISEDVGHKITHLSVCGEAGSDPALIPFFLGRGIHKLSVDPKKISGLKNYVSTLKSQETEKIAEEMLALKKLCDIEAYLREEVLGEGASV